MATESRERRLRGPLAEPCGAVIALSCLYTPIAFVLFFLKNYDDTTARTGSCFDRKAVFDRAWGQQNRPFRWAQLDGARTAAVAVARRGDRGTPSRSFVRRLWLVSFFFRI
jgi:hypothetical protein